MVSVELTRFRNHTSWSSEIDPSLTVLVGPNAAGKTNILEAIMVTTSGASFRSFSWEDLVLRGEGSGRVSIEALKEDTPVTVSLTIDAGAGGRAYEVNGRKARRVSEISYRIPVVAFVPEDLSLSKGPPDVRRTAIDVLGDRLSPAYSALRIEYSRLVRQRNALLRQRTTDEQMEPWDEMIASVGASLTAHRTRLLGRLAPGVLAAYREFGAGERLEVGYVSSWSEKTLSAEQAATEEKPAIADAIRAGLKRRRQEERDRGSTLVGPHRDDIVFAIEGRLARTHASQGQHRTVALAWKMAEISAVEDISGTRPLLLLDDVMSELDETRRQALASHILSGPQAIVTTTNLAYFSDEMLEAATVVKLGDGR